MAHVLGLPAAGRWTTVGPIHCPWTETSTASKLLGLTPMMFQCVQTKTGD